MEKTSSEMLEWRVTGMDCGSCAAKLRGAVDILPGVQDVEVALMTERLRLRLDHTQTSTAEVEKAVRGLGYGIMPKDAPQETATPHAHDHTHAGHSHGAAPAAEGDMRWHQTSKGRMVLGTGALLGLAWGTQLALGAEIAHWAFIAATLIGVAPIARKAVSMARARMPFTIEMLMTIAALGALVIGAAGEAALVVFLFTVGEMLEGVAAGKARDGIRALANLVPKTARLVEGAQIREIPAAQLTIEQIVQVRPGDRIPADGVVISGTSGVDESPVTGESVPMLKEPGAEVFAGSINTEAELRLRVSRTAEDNTIARIVRLVEEAETARAPTERFIERFSRWYMPAIVGMAALVAVLPPLMAGGDWDVWIYRGLALLLIGCPCALVISVPASIASALSTGARQGLLLKGGAVIEAAARTSLIAFDKTGTLTEGRPQITEIHAFTGTEKALLRIASAVEAGASHPLGQAILARAEVEGVERPDAKEAGAIPGKGAFATVDGVRWTVGAPRLAQETGVMTAQGRHQIERLEAEGKTVVAVFSNDHLLGLLALRDEPRADASAAMDELASMGVKTVMLTGDNARTGAAIAAQIGLDYQAGLLPEEKVAALTALTGDARVMMVGDGINDAPALATAHVGIAMGSGTDVALETADGALLRNRVSDVVSLISLARATMTNIRQNVGIALGLKGVFLITTVLGMTGLWIAILADTGATVLVTLNALRLLRFRPTKPLSRSS